MFEITTGATTRIIVRAEPARHAVTLSPEVLADDGWTLQAAAFDLAPGEAHELAGVLHAVADQVGG